jgi:hypothetical protein
MSEHLPFWTGQSSVRCGPYAAWLTHSNLETLINCSSVGVGAGASGAPGSFCAGSGSRVAGCVGDPQPYIKEAACFRPNDPTMTALPLYAYAKAKGSMRRDGV